MPVATLNDVPPDEAVAYAARDADATLRIYPKLWDRIVAMGLEGCYRMDMAVIPVVERMQATGMAVDVGHFERLGHELLHHMDVIRGDISVMTGFDINPGSGDQTAMLLAALNLFSDRPKMTMGGSRESTNDKVLESLRLAHPVIPLILDWREMAKLRNSFCLTLPGAVDGDGRIRCNLRITRVSSGRLSATGPNLLAIPVRTPLGRRIREGFVAPPDCVLGDWDLDQIEMRQLAHESEDPTLCALFNRGEDIHRQTGAYVFGKNPQDVTTEERYAAKRIGFGVITGITEVGLAEQMALAGATGWPEDRCKEVIDEWFGVYPGARSYLEACRAEARRNGYVRDMWGRIRYLPGVHSEIPRIREEALRQSHSFKISAGAQGTLKRAMAVIWRDMRALWPEIKAFRLEPLLQVHDELLFELTDDKFLREYWDALVVDRLCNTTKYRVPIKAKGGYAANWGALEH
jgi:DNA polymerase-1